MYLGLTTGFCGCCTTFASWQALIAREIFAGIVGDEVGGGAGSGAKRGGQAAMNVVLHSTLFLAAFDLGYGAGRALAPLSQ